MTRRAAALVAALAVAGCGADDEPAPVRTENDDSPSLATPTPTATVTATPTPGASATPTPPTATAPSAPAPPPDAGVPEGHGGEDQEGGAGDEEAARSPVDLVLDGEGLTPPRVAVPAFLALELTIRNDLRRTVRVRVRPGSVAFRVPAGGRRTRPLDGLRRGAYVVDAGAGRTARVTVGAEPGP